MIKLCYKIYDKKTDEYYFDLQSQKVYQICLSAYYAKQNTKGILFLLISGGVATTFLEEVSKQIILSENVRILSMILVIGILVLIDQKVKKSFAEKYRYIEEHTMGIEMEKSDLFNLYLRGRWNRRVLGIIVFAGVVIFLIGMIFMIRVSRLTGIVLLLLGGIIGVIFFHYGEFSEASQVKKYFRDGKSDIDFIRRERIKNGIQGAKQVHSALQRK